MSIYFLDEQRRMAPGQFNLADVALYGGVKTAEEIPAEYKYDTSLKDVPIYLSLKESRIADQGPSKSSKRKSKKSKDDNDFDESKSDSDNESEADQTVTIDVHTGEVLTTQSTDQESINPAPSDSPVSGEQSRAIKEPINPTPLTHSASNKQPTITDEDTDPSQSTPSPSPSTAVSDLPESVDQGPSPDEEAPPPRPFKFSEDIITRRKEQRHGQEHPTQGQGLQFPPHLSPSAEQRPGLPRRLILSSASSEHDPVSPRNDLRSQAWDSVNIAAIQSSTAADVSHLDLTSIDQR
ncbi:hypothetical protein DL95DRAFT_471212 [Leptodontidium sp. 2 PMI_412]|nr:hypothetical protein DL95DRAFT_471212 [Leptodontidium sp. 2 PMI_412]